MLRRCIDVRSHARYRSVVLMYSGHTEISDLYNVVVLRKEQVLRLYVAMDDAVIVGVPESGTNLFAIMQSLLQRDLLGSRRFLEVAALHKLKYEVMEYGSGKVTSRAMAKAADDVRMADPI